MHPFIVDRNYGLYHPGKTGIGNQVIHGKGLLTLLLVYEQASLSFLQTGFHQFTEFIAAPPMSDSKLLHLGGIETYVHIEAGEEFIEEVVHVFLKYDLKATFYRHALIRLHSLLPPNYTMDTGELRKHFFLQDFPPVPDLCSSINSSTIYHETQRRKWYGRIQ